MTRRPVPVIRQWWCTTCGRQLPERHQTHARGDGPLGTVCPGPEPLVELVYRLVER